jgi:two-component system, OmpR family, response regulator
MKKQPLIFIVDDDPIINKLVVNRFKSEGYIIEAFEYGEDCLNALDRNPDLIILDYFFVKCDMQVMDGMEAFGKIKKLRPDTPVIILSGQEKGEIVLELARKGIDDYVIKDYNLLDNLNAAIKELLDRKK